jgi:hypothetical protein
MGQKQLSLSKRILGIVSLTKKASQRDDIAKPRRRSSHAVPAELAARPQEGEN